MLQGTRISYDGELLPYEDVVARWERDAGIERKYREAERELDHEQYTLDEIDELLDDEAPWFDPSVPKSRSDYGPGTY